MKNLLFVTFLIYANADAAEPILKFIGEPSSAISAGGLMVPVFDEAKGFYPGGPVDGTPLFLTGAGIRRKKVSFVTVDVNVAASYIDSTGGISQNDPLGTLSNTEVKAMALTMVRDVTADQIKSSFTDALKANQVDLNKPGIKKLINEITFGAAKGETVMILGLGKNQPEKVILETSTGKHIEASDDGVSLDLWRCWFGTPVDSLMADLKKKLIGS